MSGLASCLYRGSVVHHRLVPRVHRLAYRLFWLYLDLDELETVDRRLRLLSLDRLNLTSLHSVDHGARDGTGLKPWVMARLAEAGIVLDRPRVRLLCMPRVLGYVFNPISVYYCFTAERLAAVVCEVKNTFGAQTAYVLPVSPKDASGTARPSCAKRMYVSPFIDMAATYDFSLRAPADRLAFVIRESVGGELVLVASQRAMRLPLDDRALAACAVGNLAMTFKVTAAIHVEAVRLWRKGVPYVPPLPSHATHGPTVGAEGGLVGR